MDKIASQAGTMAKRNSLGRPMAHNRQSLDNQIKQTKESLHKTLRQVAAMVARGEMEKAAARALLIPGKRALLLELVGKYTERMAMAPEPETVIVRKASSKVTVTPKRYARWSQK